MKLEQYQSQSRSEISGRSCHLKALILPKPCSSFEKCDDLRMKHCVPCLFASFCVSGKCPQPCRNGGKCIGKSKCKCSKGYQGDLCSKRKYPSTWSAWAWGSPPTQRLDLLHVVWALQWTFLHGRLSSLYLEQRHCMNPLHVKKETHPHTSSWTFWLFGVFLRKMSFHSRSFQVLLSIFCDWGASSLVYDLSQAFYQKVPNWLIAGDWLRKTTTTTGDEVQTNTF